MCANVCECVRMCANVCECVRMCANVCECVRMCGDVLIKMCFLPHMIYLTLTPTNTHTHTTTQTCVATLEDAHNKTIRRAVWASTGQYLAAASFDGTASVWEERAGEYECVGQLEGHENEVKCVAFDTTGEWGLSFDMCVCVRMCANVCECV